MQTIDEAAEASWDELISDNISIHDCLAERLYSVGFKEGVKFAQQWISIEDELPPCSDEDILIKGIDSDGRENMPDIGYMHSSNENKPSKETLFR